MGLLGSAKQERQDGYCAMLWLRIAFSERRAYGGGGGGNQVEIFNNLLLILI